MLKKQLSVIVQRGNGETPRDAEIMSIDEFLQLNTLNECDELVVFGRPSVQQRACAPFQFKEFEAAFIEENPGSELLELLRRTNHSSASRKKVLSLLEHEYKTDGAMRRHGVTPLMLVCRYE